MPGGHLPIMGPKKGSREWESLGSLVTLIHGHGVLRSQLLCAYCNRPLWDLETGAPQHIWCTRHMHHQPRGFDSFSGAPQHIWCAYDICTSPAGSPPVPRWNPPPAAFLYRTTTTRPSTRMVISNLIVPRTWRQYTKTFFKYWHGTRIKH